MVLAQRVNAFTTRTESVEEKKKIGVSSRVFWNSCTCNRSMWKLRHWPPSPILSFSPFLFLSCSSLTFRSSTPHKFCSFLSSHFSFPLPCLHAWEHCRPLSLLFAVPFSYLFWHFVRLRWRRVPSSPAPRTLEAQRLAPCSHFFRTYAFFLSSSLLLAISFSTRLSFRFTLSSSSAVSPPSGPGSCFAALYLSQLIRFVRID